MISKFFTTTVLPDIPASTQHTAAFAADDLLFDWTRFSIPRGPSRLVGLQIRIRGVSVVTPGAFDLVFVKSRDPKFRDNASGLAPDTLGTENAAIATGGNFRWKNEVVGLISVVAGDWNDAAMIVMYTAQPAITGREIVFQSEPASAAKALEGSVGYDTFYVAGIAQSAVDFRTTLDANGISATGQKEVTCDTVSVVKAFAHGDVIHDEDDRLIGTIQTTDSATAFTCQDNLSNATVDDKKLYNLNPIHLILSLEK